MTAQQVWPPTLLGPQQWGLLRISKEGVGGGHKIFTHNREEEVKFFTTFVR